MRRDIKYIVVHCTGTKPSENVKHIRGFYYVITRGGNIKSNYMPLTQRFHPMKEQPDGDALHIAYIGGLDDSGSPTNTLTEEQKETLFYKIVELTEKYPDAKVIGHSDWEGECTCCPCFDVKEWLRNYQPEFLMAA